MNMKAGHLLALSAAMSALLILAASEADAQERGFVNGGWSGPPVPRHGGGHHGGRFRGGFFIPYYVDREVHVVEREVIREVPVVVEPAPPPPPPRKPYKLGTSYASLPGGCMKLIEGGASYYLCSGEWYKQTGSGYVAVKAP